MKRLLSIIGSLFLAGSLYAQEVPKLTAQEEIFSKLGIPIELADYKEKAVNVGDEFSADEGGLFYVNHYDLDGDNIADVSERRDISILKSERNEKLGVISGEYNMTIFPSQYLFDKEGNQLLLDPLADGINGNEIWAGEINSEEGNTFQEEYSTL